MCNGLGYVSKYDPNLGYRVKRPIVVRNTVSDDIVGEGISDIFKTMVKPLAKALGKTAKETSKTLAKKTLNTAATETGNYVGNI